MSRGENRESKLTSITTHLSIQKKLFQETLFWSCEIFYYKQEGFF